MKKTITFFFLLCCVHSIAQKKETSPYAKFGKISANDLQTKFYAIDSNANAVVLSDIGSSVIVGNSNGWFDLKFERHTVIHILNKNGYDEANIEIPLYGSASSAERVSSFKAVTYNLENGKVAQTKLPKSELIKENVDKDHSLLKFTMPQVKEGSIIEFSYQVTSEYISMPDPWYFQSTTKPILWSEINFAVPQFFTYSMWNYGFLKLYKNESSRKTEIFSVTDSRSSTTTSPISFESVVTYLRYIVKDAPELKTEPFTRSVRNHLSRVEFQLASQSYPLSVKSYRSSWKEVASSMLESDYFGKNLNTNNNWLKDELKPILSTETDPLKRAEKIYAYVRDQFKTTSQYAVFMSGNLKSVFKSKKGSVSELNILLTAMLRYADLHADPVLLSTAGHGYVFDYLPMISSMNYVISKVNIEGKNYFLDASRSKLGFGKLPEYCYNGFACVVDENATAVNLSPDSLAEKRQVMFFVANTDKGYSGSVKKNEGYYRSLDIREEIGEKGKDEYFKDLSKKYTSNITAEGFHIDSLSNYEMPVSVDYNLAFNNNDEDIIYINPLFGENFTKNPFASAERFYPVEMPFVQEEVIMSTIETPKGYVLDELPKQIFVKLDQSGNTFFKYLISNSNGIVTLQSTLKIGKTFFMPEEYDLLREFFSMVTQKQNEQIVFKKVSK